MIDLMNLQKCDFVKKNNLLLKRQSMAQMTTFDLSGISRKIKGLLW